MKHKLCGLIGVVALFGPVSYAAASTGTVVYQGVIANTQNVYGATEPAPDVDVAGLFGGGNLEGDFITATFVYNTAVGNHFTDGATYDILSGGLGSFAASPITSATFNILNAATGVVYSYSYAPDYQGIAATQTPAATATQFPGLGLVEDVANSTVGDDAFVAFINSSSPASLFTSFSANAATEGSTSGSYFDPGLTNTGALDAINFDTDSVTVSVVPEPSTWALTIAGVGLVGFAMRRRPRPAVATVV